MAPERDFTDEFTFQTSRSGGPGGQHVNKTATKVLLRFHVENSGLLTEAEKERVQQKLRHYITQEGYLQLSCQETRSQLENKERCIQKCNNLLKQALHMPKKRKPGKPTAAARQKRLDLKKKLAARKADRRFRPSDTD